LTFEAKVSPEQRVELRQLFKEIKYGDRCRFYRDQAARLNVSVTTIIRSVLHVSLNRYAKKRDAAEPAIIDALEKAGFEVWQRDEPDLFVRKRSWPPGVVQLLEVKTGRGKKLTVAKDKRQEAQRNFLATTGTPIVRTPLEALSALKVLSNPCVKEI